MAASFWRLQIQFSARIVTSDLDAACFFLSPVFMMIAKRKDHTSHFHAHFSTVSSHDNSHPKSLALTKRKIE